LPFDNLSQLRAAIAAEVPRLGIAGLSSVDPLPTPAEAAPGVSGTVVYPIEDFYLTNPIARSSPTLQRCSAEILHGQSFQEAAE
jgi:NADH-quinone oxidoreductase subunit G